MRTQKIGGNQVTSHLKTLEKFQFVRFLKISNQKSYFKFNSNPDYDEIKFYLRKDKVKSIIRLMKNNDSYVRPTNILKQLKMNYNTIKKYLKILEKLNLINVKTEKKTQSYILNHKNYNKTIKTLRLEKIKNCSGSLLKRRKKTIYDYY
ncbi:MAG: hypothetical protein ACFFAN_16425 [Promethearchaeota archaeon]